MKMRERLLSVPVAELKAHLSKYLNIVKNGGELIVTDHRNPVARVVQLSNSDFSVLEVTAAPKKIHAQAALPAVGETDSLSVLLEDRNKR